MAKKPTSGGTLLGTNVTYSIDRDKLTLEIDLSAKGNESHSGKTNIIASSGGNKNIGDGTFVGLNVYRYIDRKDRKK